MDLAKKARGIQRSAFTKRLNDFNAKCENDNVSEGERLVAWQLLETRMQKLEEENKKYVDFLVASDIPEEVVEEDIESHEAYQLQFLMARLNLAEQSKEEEDHQQRMAAANVQVPRNEKPFKRPTLEIPKFSGSVGKWLQFWSHFRKIHEDNSVSREDKLEYLKQAMEKGSKAENVVQGFPTTAENYEKAFESLKNRFGRDDLLVEYYTRELLSLVLQNATNKGKKTSVADVFDKISAHIRALETLGVATDNCATMLYPLVESSLPEEILRTWQRSAMSNATSAEGDETTDRLTRLLQFLEEEVKNEERITMAVNGFSTQAENEKKEKPRASSTRGKTESLPEMATASALLSTEEKRRKCIFCSSNHENSACDKAKKLSFEVRKNIVRENSCCFRCLKRGHRSKDCKVKVSCGWCGNRHVIFFCPDFGNNSNSVASNKTETPVESKIVEQNLASFCSLPDVYLQTIGVVLYSDTKVKHARAVIDSGSQRSYIKTSTAEFLGYEPTGKVEIAHSLFGGVKTQRQPHDIYLVHMKSTKGDYACNFQAMSKDLICADIPTIKKTDWFKELHDKNISLCDLDSSAKDFDDSIDILIGADIAGKIMTGQKHDLSNGLTVWQTLFGWTVMGRVANAERSDAVTTTVSMFVADAKISDLWDLDTLGIKDPKEKLDQGLKEQTVKENFLKTVSLNDSKRYCVDLPWIADHAPIPNNFDLAKKRLDSTVKKLEKDGLLNDYSRVFNEWIDEGIIEIVPENELNLFAHYLPHRHIVKPESTTKIRPVFDASASEKGFPSLNQCLEKGPNLIELVPTSLLRFREHEIAVIADIRKAFLQIGVNKKDCDYLRFLWYVNGKLVVFRHKRVVFGLTCSPFILGAVLEYHFLNVARAVNEKYFDRWSKEIVDKLSKSFYVDNCTTSVDSIEELNKFVSVSKDIMSEGGFDLRGWEYTHDHCGKETTLVLGILFNKEHDTISINPSCIKYRDEEVITKRSILSAAQKIFDPIGFTCPVTLIPKLILKRLHKDKLDWDVPVDEANRKEFLQWRNQLNYLHEIEIPRKFGSGILSLHTFCDASKLAYAAVTFLRVENQEGVELKLLAAKSRVAPDNLSIPRLELLAACIGSRQNREIIKALNYENIPSFYWSDSTTVLAWLDRDKQWGIFVWNRVREIRDLTSLGLWKYVPGELNPADLPSRGCQAKQLFDSRWWEGPDWLRENSDNWPKLTGKVDENEVDGELKRSAQVSLLVTDEKTDFKYLERFSSYNKLIRFFAIMLRFKNFKLKTELYTGKRLTFREIAQTELKFLKWLQGQMFSDEKDPRLASLQIVVHSDGLIRLETKIVERKDTFAFVYPILLDGKNDIVKLMIREAHENMCHAGVQTLICHLREKFWILCMRRTVRSVVSKCITCKKFVAKKMQADSAPLPIHRVKDTAVFEVIGVDFAGPVFLRGQKKGWICLFTCAVYRAVHLELVTSMSTKAFLDCFRRFMDRRGRPSIVYSDNGTNFVGADNAFASLNWHTIEKYSSARRIDWRFNPPSAAWWGGWWERLIGMLKVILRKVLGKTCLDYEEMYTVLCDCELTLNSRPLTYVSEESNDLMPLTPLMFLNSIKETETPDIDVLNQIDLNESFVRKQEFIECLRIRFRNEYLSQLISKGNVKESRKLKEGDVVIVGDDNRKRINWPLARIEKLILGRDGVVRVAILKTKDGLLRRPIQRIYPLEITSDSIEETDTLREKAIKKMKKDSMSTKDKGSRKEEEIKTRCGRVVKKPTFYSC